jgi:hypothetical protein
MARLGWTLVGVGFLLQLLIPLNAVDLSGRALFGIPGPLLGILFASVAMVVGILFIYLFWYKNRAVNLDRPDGLDRPERPR